MTSTYKGSTYTAQMVAEEIGRRWGKDEIKNYDPTKNCFTLMGWNERGYKVIKGQKAIHSITFVTTETKDKKTGKVKSESYPKNVFLFYHLQVEKRK